MRDLFPSQWMISEAWLRRAIPARASPQSALTKRAARPTLVAVGPLPGAGPATMLEQPAALDHARRLPTSLSRRTTLPAPAAGFSSWSLSTIMDTLPSAPSPERLLACTRRATAVTSAWTAGRLCRWHLSSLQAPAWRAALRRNSSCTRLASSTSPSGRPFLAAMSAILARMPSMARSDGRTERARAPGAPGASAARSWSLSGAWRRSWARCRDLATVSGRAPGRCGPLAMKVPRPPSRRISARFLLSLSAAVSSAKVRASSS
mmetsp:Transcript_11126/g.37870  ORF Transcript_11126/g.37870 Transcript_11126/m.37870 type:complete len:263 (-) Transcript_11126:449-1237(-)